MPSVCQGMQPSCQAVSLTPKAAAQGWRRTRVQYLVPPVTGPHCLAAGGIVSRQLASLAEQTKSQSSTLVSTRALVLTFAHRPGPCISACTCQIGKPLAALNSTKPLGKSRTTASRRLSRPPGAVPDILSTLAASPHRDYVVVVFAAIGAAIWVKIFDLLAANNVLEQKLSRKIVHTTSGALFVLTWTLFSAAPTARYLAAVVPMLNGARLLAVGSGIVNDQGLVKSVSRSGDRGELLKGPLVYVVTLVAATALCWRDNPAGLIAVSMMCGGDGLADIVGRRWGGSAKLPWNKAKSWAGSFGMLVGGYGMSYCLILLFCSLGFFSCYPPSTLMSCLGTIALVSTVVESLPINQVIDDNVSVPLAAACLSVVLLPQPVEVIIAAVDAAARSPMAELAVTATTAAAAAAVVTTPVGLVL